MGDTLEQLKRRIADRRAVYGHRNNELEADVDAAVSLLEQNAALLRELWRTLRGPGSTWSESCIIVRHDNCDTCRALEQLDQYEPSAERKPHDD